MSLQICLAKNCTCLHHLVLYLFKTKQNDNAKLLLENIENFCQLSDTSGLTLLHYAVQFENGPIVQYLIKKGCNINARDHQGATPLTTAIDNESENMIELLLKNNADIYEQANPLQLILNKTVHFYIIRRKQDYQPIVKIVEQMNVDFISDRREKLISLLKADDITKFVSVVFGNSDLANFVLENDYPFDFKEPMGGCTALHCAIICARMKNAKLLIEHGANVKTLNNMDWSPLSYYSNYCENDDTDFEVLKSLIRGSITPAVSKRTRADLEYLIRSYNKQIVKVVLQSGIDVTTIFSRSQSLIELLITNKDSDAIGLLDELNIEFDVNTIYKVDRKEFSSKFGNRVLSYALQNRDVKKIEFLLKHDADIKIISLKWNIALFTVQVFIKRSMEEPLESEAEIIELLLQYDEDTDTVDTSKWPHKLLRTFTLTPRRLSIKFIIAHLALLKVLDKSPLTKDSLRKIVSVKDLKDLYQLWIKQLKKINKVKFYNNLSLFELLREKKQEILLTYVRDENFMLAFNQTIEKTPLDLYYKNVLQKKIKKAFDIIETEKKAAVAL